MLKNLSLRSRLQGTLLFAASSAFALGPAHVPGGTTVMVDGKMSPGEWSDAAAIEAGSGAKLFAKRSANYVYLAVELPKDRNMSVDLYIAGADGVITDLHSSAKLGERTLSSKTWPSDWVWWNNVDWIANVSRFDSFVPPNFLTENVREFQIDRSRFKGSSWRVMLEIRLLKPQRGGIESTIIFPKSATNIDVSEWLELRLN
jgi:hypothetical protein